MWDYRLTAIHRPSFPSMDEEEGDSGDEDKPRDPTQVPPLQLPQMLSLVLVKHNQEHT